MRIREQAQRFYPKYQLDPIYCLPDKFTASFVHKERFAALQSYCILELCESILYEVIFACTCFISRVISSLTVSDFLNLWVGFFLLLGTEEFQWSEAFFQFHSLTWAGFLSYTPGYFRVLTLHLVKGDILSKHNFHFGKYWLRCFVF